MKQNKQFFRRLLAVAFWLAVWQAAAMAIGQEVFLVSPLQAFGTLVQLLPQAEFWQRVAFSAGHILLGFVVERRRCAAGSGDAAGQGHAGGKLYHSGAGLGAGQCAFGAYQLFDGAAGAVRCGAHRHCRGRRAAAGNGSGVPSAAGSLGICWKSGVAAEVIGLPNGSIGDALYRAKITLSTGELFAWTFVIILLSAGFEKLFLLALDKAVGAVLGEEGTKC